MPADDTLRTQETGSDLDNAAFAPIPIPGLTILCHPDPQRVGERVALAELTRQRSVAVGRFEPLFEPVGEATPRGLDDPRLSRQPIFVRPRPDGTVAVDAGSTKTRLKVDGDEVEGLRELTPEDLRHGVVFELGSRIALLLHHLEPTVVAPPSFGWVGESAAIWRLRREVARVADLDVPVLLRGETGTGKELAARAIQSASRRRGKPYHSINMAAVPPSLAASELFGAAKGAFSGADKRRPGYFERADGGTLFLDEIGETPVEIQALLLRALESGEIQPVGSEVPRRVDVRVITATDADLDEAIAEGRFRAPLLHRLAGFEIELPNLRERRDDIGRLFFHFLRQEFEALGVADRLIPAGRGRPFVSADLVARLTAYPWSGNVRELRNVVHQLVIASRGEERLVLGSRVEKRLAGAHPRRLSPPPSIPTQEEERHRPSLAERRVYRDPGDVGEDELISTLEAHQYRIQPTAAALGLSRTSLYVLIDACPRVRKAADLSSEEIEASAARHDHRLPAMAAELGVSLHALKMRRRELGLS